MVLRMWSRHEDQYLLGGNFMVNTLLVNQGVPSLTALLPSGFTVVSQASASFHHVLQNPSAQRCLGIPNPLGVNIFGLNYAAAKGQRFR